MLGLLPSNLKHCPGGFHYAFQHLAAQISATQRPWVSPAPVVYSPQKWFGSTLVPGREWGGGHVSGPAVSSAPHPETKHKDQGSFVSGHTQGHRGLLSHRHHSHPPVLTLAGTRPPGPPHQVIFSCSEEWEGLLHHGAASRSRLPLHRFGRGVGGRGGGAVVDHFPYSGGEETLPRDATARLCKGRPLEAQLQGRREGVRTPRPSLFCSAPHPPGPCHPLQARGERDPRLPPRPATPACPPPHCPQRLGGGGCKAETGPAPPAATQEAPRGPPVRSPSGSRPRR